MPRAKSNCNMELKCSLCPKNPKFSDVSHLLTHMSSKGHLAHRFKLQIRSQGETEARQRLENFDFWYHANNLDSLLSDRLAAKEQKKGRKNRIAPCPVSKNNKTSNLGRQSPISDDQNGFRAPIPRMHLWSTAVDGTEGYNDNNRQPEDNINLLGQGNSTPNSPGLESVDKLDFQLNTWKPAHEIEEKYNNDSDKFAENTKLKGVLWPGMNLFDSATTEQKRMRNQRKGNEVLADMICTSEQVEPAEVSYHATGEFRASRDIFGPLSGDESPSRDPTPKRRKSVRRTTMLRDLSTNAPNLRVQKEKKMSKDGFCPKNQYILAPSSVFTQPSLNPLTAGLAYNRQFQTSDENEEFHLTFNENLNGKKRGFSIFQDSPDINSGRTDNSLQDNQPDDFTTSDAGPERHYTNDRSLRFHQKSLSPFSSQIEILSGITKTSPSPISSQPQHFGDKENFQPDMKNDSLDQQSLSSTHFFPSQLFYETPLNPLYHHGYAQSFTNTNQADRSETKSPKFSSFNVDLRSINPLAGAQHSPSCSTGNTLHYNF
ncbi:putative type-2 protein geranylgeranyltransferase subunit beta protein [Golovinomyces cichoracearum]|uniref:Putative type-2 protein geranylgeranyltransferase subunit beta protein n=1 Tax=Golovinomyces cichoracearum TaxID=62708 RepID=A0A420HDY2_9PEZI|nr:putative type-2 protein geranylgeranyltransferase subunit beta protein [Golovinomyces cichoracearum]